MQRAQEILVSVAPMADAMARLGEWARRRRIRASYGAVSEVLLRDAGLTPGDVEAALALPLAEDASGALARAAVARAANW